MSRLLDLDDFGARPSQEKPAVAQIQDTIDLEAIREASFEKGYENGWEDCRKAQAENMSAVSSDLAQSVKDLEVTYQEVRTDLIGSVEELLTAIVQQLLPNLAESGLVSVVHDQLLPIIRETTEKNAEIIAAPSAVPMLERLLEEEGLDLRLHPEPAYAASQVSLQLGMKRHEIDLSRAISEISRSIEEFNIKQLSSKEIEKEQLS